MVTGATSALEEFRGLDADGRDEFAHRWWDSIYYCPECDDADPPRGHRECPRYPRGHDATGYMGTGTDYPADMRKLARAIARD